MSRQNQKSIELDLARRNFLSGSVAVTAGLSLAAVSGLVAAPPAAVAAAAAPAAAPAPAPAARPAPKAKALLVERHLCTGCNRCVYACSVFHDKVVRPATARIHVRRYFGSVDVTSICWHCVDAPCVTACPVTPQKAIQKNKDTNVVEFTDENLCLGAECNRCMMACPPQYLRRHPDTAKPLFCDLCGGDPQCVKACAMQNGETGIILRADTRPQGLHVSYREVTPIEAAEGVMQRLFYPNMSGERIDLFQGGE